MPPLFTIADYIKHIRTSFDNPKALNSYVNHAWVSLSTHEFLDEVKYVALALKDMGFQSGDKIGILASSLSRWTIVDLAILSIGAISIPIFTNISEDNFHFIVLENNLSTFFLEGAEAWEKYKNNPAIFKKTISLEYNEDLAEKHVHDVLAYSALLSKGRAMQQEHPSLYEELLAQHRPEQTATIIYTSGSSGVPKGVEHTHASFVGLLNQDPYHLDPSKDTYLNILTLAHIFARVFNSLMLVWGIPVYYFNDIKQISVILRNLHPSIMIVVPRILEKIYNKMVATIHDASFFKRTIGDWAFALANQEQDTTWKHLFHPIAEKLVYSHLREALGDRLRIVVSGGAALNPHLNHFFLDIGIPVYQGYGLTEACPLTTNSPDHNKMGTIGIPIKGIQIKISDEGEILIKGAKVMKGYFNNSQETSKAINGDGWLHTGDKGTIDADGFVVLIGRIEELYKTSTAEIVAPVPIEHALGRAPFIDTAVVISENRKYVTCLLAPNKDVVASLKVANHLEYLSDEEFLNSDFIKQKMEKLLEEINSKLNHWEQIRDYRFTESAFTITGGELTPTMKIIRKKIEEKYSTLIESMYKEKIE